MNLNIAPTAEQVTPEAAATGLAPQTARDRDPLQKAAREFESIFMSLMLKELRSTSFGDGLFAGDSGDMLGSMFDQYLGEHMANAGGLGLADFIASAERGSDLSSLRQSLNDARQEGMEAYRNAVSY